PSASRTHQGMCSRRLENQCGRREGERAVAERGVGRKRQRARLCSYRASSGKKNRRRESSRALAHGRQSILVNAKSRGEFAAVCRKKIEGATAAGLLALRLLRPLIDP